jgi:hypothetical protein
LLTPIAMMAAADTIRPPWRTFISGVQPDIPPITFQWPGQVIDLTAQPGDLAFRDATHARDQDRIIDRASGDALK